MTPVNVLNGSKLNEIATASPTAQEVTLYHSSRQRMRGTTDLPGTEQRLLRMGKKIVHVEYTKYWTDLEAAGVGSIVRGRNGNPDRFAWNYSLKEVAKASIEGKDFKAETIKTQPKKVVHQAPKRRRKLVIAAKRRPGRPPMIASVNLSKGEIETLKRILSKASRK